VPAIVPAGIVNETNGEPDGSPVGPPVPPYKSALITLVENCAIPTVEN
jgi:hypothetical protein